MGMEFPEKFYTCSPFGGLIKSSPDVSGYSIHTAAKLKGNTFIV
jgi:hypothetical protein